MHIRYGTCLAFRYSRRSSCRVGIDEQTVLQLCRAVCILSHQQHALAILMEIKGRRIAVEVLQHAGLGRRIDLCCHARAGHRSHLAVAVVRRNGRDEVRCACRRAVEQSAHHKSAETQLLPFAKIRLHNFSSLEFVAKCHIIAASLQRILDVHHARIAAVALHAVHFQPGCRIKHVVAAERQRHILFR